MEYLVAEIADRKLAARALAVARIVAVARQGTADYSPRNPVQVAVVGHRPNNPAGASVAAHSDHSLGHMQTVAEPAEHMRDISFAAETGPVCLDYHLGQELENHG